MIKNLKLFKKPNTKLKLCTLSIIGVLAISTMSGCGEKYYSDIDNNHENISTEYYSDQTFGEETKKEFGVGEHIISVPIQNDVREKNTQYNYFEGYEVIGVDVETYGKYTDKFAGGCILYMNINPVKCKITSYEDHDGLRKGFYTNFGTPIEIEMEMEAVR